MHTKNTVIPGIWVGLLYTLNIEENSCFVTLELQSSFAREALSPPPWEQSRRDRDFLEALCEATRAAPVLRSRSRRLRARPMAHGPPQLCADAVASRGGGQRSLAPFLRARKLACSFLLFSSSTSGVSGHELGCGSPVGQPESRRCQSEFPVPGDDTVSPPASLHPAQGRLARYPRVKHGDCQA